MTTRLGIMAGDVPVLLASEGLALVLSCLGSMFYKHELAGDKK
jgi:hypothetical protein